LPNIASDVKKIVDAQQLIALKRLEADLQTQLFSLSLTEQQLSNQDREQARQRRNHRS